MVCGFVALSLSVLSLHASDLHASGLQAPGVRASVANAHRASAPSAACSARVVQIGAVNAVGCWRHAGSRWRATAPVQLNGMKLAGAGMVTLDPRTRTITSSARARWLLGTVEFRRAPLALRVNKPLTFTATGAVHGLGFTGAATLTFTRADGGTTTLTTKLDIPGVAGDVSGDAVLTVSRRHGFDVRKLHVKVGELPLGRLLFKQLELGYARDRWSADAAVRLPAFTGSAATLAGHLEIANRRILNIGVTGNGLSIPLGEGFVLTKAGLDLGLGPLVIQGSGSATYGPPIAGGGPLVIDGKLQYSSVPERWEATGKASLPWGIPGVKPSATVGLQVDPGRAMIFTGDLDLSVHGWGLKGHLDGFASRKAFNAEGTSTLNLTALRLGGTALVSSRGMAACGKIHLLFLGKKLGFGYTWGGALDVMGSSCDVGRFRVSLAARRALAAAPTQIVTSSPAGFAVFAAHGGDFQVAGPTGTFATTSDHDDQYWFAAHDSASGWAYLAIPVTETDSAYTVTPVAPGGTLDMVTVAGGLKTHAGTGDVTAGVTGSGANLTLNYGIDASQFEPGETVSFYQGASQVVAGAEPIVEDTTTSNSAPFTPEPLGPATRAVFAVISIDGVPREQFPVAFFDATPVALPAAVVFVRAAPRGWAITLGKPQRVSTWQVLTAGVDGTRQWQEVPGTASTFAAPPGTATISLTPVDQLGRTGPTYLCDTANPGACPPG
jgi:hypothetical protein